MRNCARRPCNGAEAKVALNMKWMFITRPAPACLLSGVTGTAARLTPPARRSRCNEPGATTAKSCAGWAPENSHSLRSVEARAGFDCDRAYVTYLSWRCRSDLIDHDLCLLLFLSPITFPLESVAGRTPALADSTAFIRIAI